LKLSQTLNDVLNEQILKELQNQNIYSQISSFFESLQLKNLASYFKKQSLDEKSHADKFMDHINDRTGGVVFIGEVDAPNLNLFDVFTVADAYVRVEEDTTKSIEEIYDLALNEKSYMDLGFLQDMLSEQVKEEDESQELSTKLKMCKDLVLFDATMEG
jgi:ferritin